MILSLGGFAFESKTPIQSIKRERDFGITSKERFKNHPAHFAGKKGKEEIEIIGITLPNNGAKLKALGKLYALAEKQQVYNLTTGYGRLLGKYVILSISENQESFLPSGEFLQQSFTLKLERSFE